MAPCGAAVLLGLVSISVCGGAPAVAAFVVLPLAPAPSSALLAPAVLPRRQERAAQAWRGGGHGARGGSLYLRASSGSRGQPWRRWGDSGDLKEWGTENGIWCPWDVMETGGDRSVVAVQSHRAGDIICRVPRDAAWEAAPGVSPAVPAGFIAPSYWASEDAASDKKGWYVKLAVKLLYERSLRPPQSDRNTRQEDGGRVGGIVLGGDGPYICFRMCTCMRVSTQA
jgi:hypothetical protein